MRARRRSATQSLHFRGRPTVLAVLAALVVTLSLSAAPPTKTPDRADEPLAPVFQPPAEIRPENLAALTIGNQFTPRAGLWSALASLYGGAHPDVQVWNLRGPFSTRPGRIQVGASTLFLNGFGLDGQTAFLRDLATLQAGEDRDCWNLLNTDVVRPFPRLFRQPGRIRDRHGFVNGDPEIEIYAQVIIMAHYTSAEAFTKAARRDVTYVHLFNEPERYRGEVVRVSGRLRRLQRFDPPDEARAAGVSDLYEGWVFTDRFNEHPACVVFTDLPPGLKVEGDREVNVEGVSFDGYFYKRYRYKAYDTKKANEARDAPLLIGHTLMLPATPGEPDNWGHRLIWVFLAVVGGALAAVAGVTFWFRYHDRRVRSRILATRNRDFVPPPDAPPPPEGPPDEAGPGIGWGGFPPAPN